jgi:hypothetical protein
MKYLTTILFVSLLSCGPQSSPEGRSKIRDEKLQTQVDELIQQNKAIVDTLSSIRKEITRLKQKQ